MSAATMTPEKIRARMDTLRRAGKPEPAVLADLLTYCKLSGDDAQMMMDEKRRSKFAARQASSIERVSVEWLWTSYLPLGALSLIFGPEGEGKSATTMMLAAKATLGTLPGALKGKPTDVEIIAYEDDAAAVIVPRLVANGADLDRIWIHGGDDGENLILPDDVPAFEQQVADRGSKFVIVDPLTDGLREGLKDNNNNDVRKAIVPLGQMAARLGASVLGVAHPNKSQTEAANRVMGSRAWRSVPRSVLLHGLDPDNLEGDTRIVAVSKSNYGPKVAHKLRIRDEKVPGIKGTMPRVEMVEASKHRDHDLLIVGATGKKGEGKELSQSEKATNLIYDLLEGSGGSIEAKTAYAAGEAAGISEAVMRAARRGIRGLTKGSVWEWEEGVEAPLSIG